MGEQIYPTTWGPPVGVPAAGFSNLLSFLLLMVISALLVSYLWHHAVFKLAFLENGFRRN